MSLHFRDVEVGGRRVDVAVASGVVSSVGPDLRPSADAEVIDGNGAALIPGLWDHHIHLAALAANRQSVMVGPPEVTTADELADVLSEARRSRVDAAAGIGRWVRAVGYHESVAGDLDRDRLEHLVPDVPTRLQHRSGAMWVLNRTAVELLGLDDDLDAPVDRDAAGRPTGRILGADSWLRTRIAAVSADAAPGARPDFSAPDFSAPDFSAVGAELAAYGVVGVTDATPSAHLDDLRLLADAATTGALPQRVVAMGGPALTDSPFPAPLRTGPVKVLLADHSLPSLDALVGWIGTAHAEGRAVAIHCVTRASLVLALTALDAAGSMAGDRIEHGSVVPPELDDLLLRLGATVVTQPNFVSERGDEYLRDVDPQDRPHLYRCASLESAGVPVAGSTDAPFGHPDPWRAIRAATTRETQTGQELGAAESVDPRRALGMFLGDPTDPGRTRRRIAPGVPADLCLLDASLADAVAEPSARRVRLTVVDGQIVHRVDAQTLPAR